MNKLAQATRDNKEGLVSQGLEPVNSGVEVDFGALRRLFNEKVIIGIAFLIDMLSVATGVVIVDAYGSSPEVEHGSAAILAILFFSLWNFLVFHHYGFYGLNTILRWPVALKTYLLIAVAVLAPLSLFAFLKPGLENGLLHWMLSVGVFTYMLIWSLRYLFYGFTRLGMRRRMIGQDIAVIGYGDPARRFINGLHEFVPGNWWNIIGIFDERRSRITDTLEGVPVLGKIDDVIDYARNGKIQHVVIALPWSARDRLHELCEILSGLPVMVSLAYDPELLARRPQRLLDYYTGTPALDINHLPSFGWAGIVKLLEDKVLSLILLILFSPLLILIAVLVKMDSRGPVLFRQERYGFNKKMIHVYKFRTMYHNPNGVASFRQASKNDARVTRIGRFLRKTSLDELPQLINVLMGDMSLVGPRPHPVELDASFTELVAGLEGRLNVKPGITGWAQINGYRGETDTLEKMASRVKYDIFYIEHWNLWLDIRILFRTAFKGWVHENAY
jgi:Undecaprenyl-phosphate glucose phosphotransferase